jgi:hypothetical protein
MIKKLDRIERGEEDAPGFLVSQAHERALHLC